MAPAPIRTMIFVHEGDLTKGPENILVNSSNTNAALGSGVSGAIRNTCGPTYQDYLQVELQARFGGPMEPGQVLVTNAGTHPTAKFVAHAAVMDYRADTQGSVHPNEARIEMCADELWKELEKIPMSNQRVAVPAMGTGVGNLGLKLAVDIIAASLEKHLAATPNTKLESIHFYGYEFPEYANIAEILSLRFPLHGLTKDVEDLVNEFKASQQS